RHYGEEIARLRREMFSPARPARGDRGGYDRGGGGFRARRGPLPSLAETKASLLAAAAGEVEEVLREAVILATLVTHPRLIETFETAFERVDMATDDHRLLQRLLLSHAHDRPAESGAGGADGDPARAAADFRDRIAAEAGADLLDKLFSLNHVRIAPALRRPDDTALAELCLAEELAKLEATRGARREVQEAAEEIDALADEGLTFRLSEANKARDAAARGKGEDKQLYERADNGVLIAREEKDALDALLEGITYAKSGGKPS
ncbi:MAG: DNA primase, partial [Maritimibacter sp.]|nr:DNA primase [Maritimibacter sp.]